MKLLNKTNHCDIPIHIIFTFEYCKFDIEKRYYLVISYLLTKVFLIIKLDLNKLFFHLMKILYLIQTFSSQIDTKSLFPYDSLTYQKRYLEPDIDSLEFVLINWHQMDR